MAQYLAEHVPHLQSLHVQLGLPADALAADEAEIEDAIRKAVTTLIHNREAEVESWRQSIQAAEDNLTGLSKAIGGSSRQVVQTGEHDALPRQHAMLLEARKTLETAYTQRLEQINDITSRIGELATLLGPPIEPPQPLQPIAGPSRRSTGGRESRKSNSRTSQGKFKNQSECDKEVFLDVRDEILQRLEMDLQTAIQEKEARVQLLADHCRDLLFFHVELALPRLPTASSPNPDFPPHLLPTSDSSDPRPKYLEILVAYIDDNADLLDPEGEADQAQKSLEDIEPEQGLISWLAETIELWTTERDNRMDRIQDLYDKLEPMWARLEVDAETQELFIEMNRGCGKAVISAYEAELERCLELRRSSLSSFVISLRKEIESLWEELMTGEDEKGEFGPFIDDDYSEELLEAHEEEVARLHLEIESKATLLPKVREWHTLKAEEEELEKLSLDPNRFSRRGGAMLREEKLRKRVGVLLPRVENEMLNLLTVWEEENGRAFLVQGQNVVNMIYEAREAKEMAKEAKKRAKLGLSGTALAPTKSVRATPATGTKSAGQKGSTIRKRGAPSATPMSAIGTAQKRQKVGMGTATNTNRTNGQTSRNVSKSSRVQDPSSSPTPQGSQLPRIVNGRSVSGSSGGSNVISRSPTKQKVIMGRRESFKPRQSNVANLLAAVRQVRENWTLEEEDEGMI